MASPLLVRPVVVRGAAAEPRHGLLGGEAQPFPTIVPPQLQSGREVACNVGRVNDCQHIRHEANTPWETNCRAETVPPQQ